MSQTVDYPAFVQWLAANRKRDENVISGERTIEEIRLKLQAAIIEYFKETKDQVWCNCDTCVLIRLKARDKRIADDLAYAGLEYLLGENFNGMAVGYYYYYYKGLTDDDC